MRIYDFQEYRRQSRVAGEFGWTMREYKQVVRAVDSLFEDLDFGSDSEASPERKDQTTERTREENSGDSASAQT